MSIAVDLDGTLAKYTTWKGHSVIGDVVPLMKQQVLEWIRQGKEVVIFSARASDREGVAAIKRWLEKNGLGQLRVTNIKEPEMQAFYDDRAVYVERNTGKIL